MSPALFRCLKAYGGIRWPWNWQGYIPDWSDTAATFDASCPAADPAIALGLANALRFQPLQPPLVLHTTYYATLRVTNEAGLVATKSSDGVTWTETPLEGGEVDDGPVPLQDLQWQSAADALSASWQEFYSFYGPQRYEVRDVPKPPPPPRRDEWWLMTPFPLGGCGAGP